jgi:hypothetical protein
MLMKRHKFIPILALASAIAMGLLFGLVTPSNGRSGTLPLTASQIAGLASQGISFSPAQTAAPSGASQSNAATAASQAHGGQAAQSAVWMHCQDTARNPALNQDCWVVSLDITGMKEYGAPGTSATPATFAIELVDPSTGQVIEGVEGNT